MEKSNDVEKFPHISYEYRALILYTFFWLIIGLGFGIVIGHEPDGKILAKWYHLQKKHINYCDKKWVKVYADRYKFVECFTVIGKYKMTKEGAKP